MNSTRGRSVLAVGGGGSGFAQEPVLEAERYDPESETWTTMAAQQESRMHHSVAILLPDGRVLSTGQTAGTTGNLGELYSPPYLFQGPRPTITDVSDAVGFAQPMAIQSPDAGQIDRVALIRPGSVTHGVDFTQRYVDLSFTEGAGVVNAISPADGRIAPPGWYTLVIVDDDGVPSVANWVKVG